MAAELDIIPKVSVVISNLSALSMSDEPSSLVLSSHDANTIEASAMPAISFIFILQKSNVR